MKCHYEILNVPRDADEGAIKSSYKKLALRLHPDKNLDDPEAAKEQFQFLQQAYEVLSDPQERAWYDNHRDEILKGRHTDYEEDCLDVFQYFTSTCFRGYDPSEPKNFYAVYGEVFSTIFSEDFEYMTEAEVESVPTFGTAGSDYETVVREFYGYAESYSTKKSYAWLFPHNVAEIKHRRVCKILDKENKKIQQKARKERNEEVRNLVAFVKKRDRRVQAYKKILEERAELNRLKSQQEQYNQIRRRNEELEEQIKRLGTTVNQAHEDELDQLEQLYLNGDSSPEEEDEEFDENLFCEACNRLFKDEGSYKNHLSTKKHRTNVMLFSIQVEKEEEEEDEDPVEEEEPVEEGDLAEDPEDILDEPAPSNSTKKSKKAKKQQVVVEEEPEEVKLTVEPDSDSDWGEKKSKKSKGKGKKQEKQKEVEVESTSNPTAEENEDWGDKKGKKAKKAKAQKSKVSEDQPEESSLKCATCNSIFPSKNKLFDHLKKTNHSVYLPKSKR